MADAHTFADERVAHIDARIDELARVLAQTPDERWNAPAEMADEAAWSGAEVCGHIAELLTYWAGVARLLADQPGMTFGRPLEDGSRLGGVQAGTGRGRMESVERLRMAAAGARDVLRTIPDRAWDTRGTSLSRGPMSVADIVDLFIIAHLDEHIEQIRHTTG